jgi:hypothetical protein
MSERVVRFTAALVLCAVLASAGPALAQGVTAQVSGAVVDASGGVVPGVTVTITNADTNWNRRVMTGSEGRFVFVDVLAGTYSVSAALEGFKTVRADLSVGSTDRVDLRALVLEAGVVLETVRVVAGEADLVQTTTGARSTKIGRPTMEDIALKGRDVIGMLKLLPGVVDTNAREAPNWQLLFGLTINGRNTLNFNLAYDGINNKDTAGGNIATPSVDSIGEIRVQSSNFQAEYGRSSGASITLITRSGSNDFRGSAGFYKRDSALNGNEYLRVQQCRQNDRLSCHAPLYKFDNVAWTLSGPIRRNRLFFFWSQEVLSRTDPGTLNLIRMPTALERNGDFSQTFNSAGGLVFIRDHERQGGATSEAAGRAVSQATSSRPIASTRLDSRY